MDRFPSSGDYQPRAETIHTELDVLAAWAVVNANTDLHLATADFAPTPTMVPGDLTEASYAGYAAKSLTWASFSEVQYQSNGDVRVQSTTLASFAGPTSGGPVTIYGWYLTEHSGTTRLFRVYHLDVPVTLADNHSFLNIIPTVSFKTGAH